MHIQVRERATLQISQSEVKAEHTHTTFITWKLGKQKDIINTNKIKEPIFV